MSSLHQHIIISRTDNLGDVMLTLPLAGFLKQYAPKTRISFLGKSYTEPLIACCRHIDDFIDRAQVLADPKLLGTLQADAIIFVFPDKAIAQAAAQAGIPLRVGSGHRWWHWLYANKWVFFSRKKSELHEAQLNFKLLKALGIEKIPSLESLSHWYGFEAPALEASFQDILSAESPNVILHPKSKGSAREWPLAYYEALVQQHPEYHFIVTGTAEEGTRIVAENKDFFAAPNVSNASGKLSLLQLIALIGRCDALVACSTGPLHIAAALGIRAVGIYPPIRPMHPGRWQALGKGVEILVLDKNCEDCRQGGACACIQAISVEAVSKAIAL